MGRGARSSAEGPDETKKHTWMNKTPCVDRRREYVEPLPESSAMQAGLYPNLAPRRRRNRCTGCGMDDPDHAGSACPEKEPGMRPPPTAPLAPPNEMGSQEQQQRPHAPAPQAIIVQQPPVGQLQPISQPSPTEQPTPPATPELPQAIQNPNTNSGVQNPEFSLLDIVKFLGPRKLVRGKHAGLTFEQCRREHISYVAWVKGRSDLTAQDVRNFQRHLKPWERHRENSSPFSSGLGVRTTQAAGHRGGNRTHSSGPPENGPVAGDPAWSSAGYRANSKYFEEAQLGSARA